MGVRLFIFVSVCYAFVPRSVAEPAGSCLLQAHTSRSQGQTPQEHDLDSLLETNQDGLALALTQGNVHHIESVIASQVEKNVQERDVPADVAANFQAIRDYLTTLRNALLVEHANDQNATDRLRDLASSCFDTMTKTEVDSRRTKHSECRVEQGKSSGRKATKCKTFEDKKAALPAAPCTLSTVVGTDPVADAETYIACLHQLNLWSAKVQDLWQAHLACKNATDNVTNTTQECGTKQTSFEAGFCSLVGACDCHSEHAQAFTVQRTQTEASEAGRRASFNAAARIECFIGVLEGNSTLRNESYHDCRSLDVNTTHLFIEYDPIPSAGGSCTFSNGKPCETTWVDAEYTTASWYSKAPTDACTDCPTTTLTTSPAPEDSDLDGGGWKLVWKHSYMEVGTVTADMKFFSAHDRPCTDLSVGWCNVPNKLSFGANQQMTMALHNDVVQYAYRGDINAELDSGWRGAILNNYVKLVDNCKSSNGDPPEPEGPNGGHRLEGITFDKTSPGNYVSNCDTDRNGNGDCRWENCHPHGVAQHSQMTLAIFIRDKTA